MNGILNGIMLVPEAQPRSGLWGQKLLAQQTAQVEETRPSSRWLRGPVLLAQGQGPEKGNKWAPGSAVPSDRSLWACFRASCLQLAWLYDLPKS